VPIAETEARRVRDLVEALPEPRRSTVQARFAAARRRLEEAGLLEMLRHPESWDETTPNSFGLDYFHLGIACPFLEEESCSIHPERPIACREYLVTSPAENCSRPTPEIIRRVPMPARFWRSVARFDPVPPSARTIRWVPLILALEWADAHPDEGPSRPPIEWFSELLERLTEKQVDAGDPGAPSPAPVSQEPKP
jgi:Fe-S-cluster containining protein